MIIARWFEISIIVAGFFAALGASWQQAMDADRRHDEVDEALWGRRIEDYRARARDRAEEAQLARARDAWHVERCHGRIRRPLGAAGSSLTISGPMAAASERSSAALPPKHRLSGRPPSVAPPHAS